MSGIVSYAQCYQNVSFTNWRHTGDSISYGQYGCYIYNQWVLGANDTSVASICNTSYPKFFVGPDTLINVRITGTFEVQTYSDDDYVGFVFGFQEEWDYNWFAANSNMDHEYYLFDWKKNGQTWSGYTANEGFSLCKVNATISKNLPSVFPKFWNHTSSAGFQVLQTQFSTTNGWVSYTEYDFELYYTPTRAVILIDSDTIFDQSGCFEPGLFGFYSFSQSGTQYWDFNYELFIDFGFEAQNVCLGDTMDFIFIDTGSCYNSNTYSNLDTFYWDLGDGTLSNDTNPSHLYDTAGAYTVNLIATDINGCTDTASKVIYIHEAPNAEIDFGNVCKGDTMAFADSTSLPYGSIIGWNWDFGDGNTDTTTGVPEHLYNQSGYFTVQLAVEDNAGCVDTTDTVVQVYPNPTPQFLSLDACDGTDVYLEDQSLEALSGISAIEWDMESNGTVDYTDSTIVNHTYATHGQYAVQLTVYDSLGCRDSLTEIVTVYPMPTADFEAPSVCFHEASMFQDSSEVATGSIQAWDWDFGDGSSSTTPQPSYTFLSSGQQNVELLVTSEGGCQDSILKTIVVYHLPVAIFETDPQCRNLPVNFIQNSTSQSGTISTYDWNFGDGNTALSAGPIHNYNTPGAFLVNLEVTTQHGCKDTAQANIRIYPEPQAAFNWTNNVCEGEPLPIFDQSSIGQFTPGGDQIVSWDWDVNGMALTVQNPVYLTSYFEKLDVFLLVTSNHGCVDSTRNFPQIFPIPEPDFTEEMGCNERESKFTDLSVIGTGLIDQWSWDFGDGQTSDSANPTNVYALSGDYDVRLHVTSNKGCENESFHSVHVHETPQVDFNVLPEFGCSPHRPRAVNLSKIAIGEMTYQWNVNGKYVTDEMSPRFTLENDTLEPKPFDVLLKATSDKGCYASKKKEDVVWVYPSPKAKFGFENKGVNLFEPVVNFKNKSEHSVRWQWRFDDGLTSVDFAPSHEFGNSGTYNVRLVAWNAYECPDTTYKIVEVEPITTLYIPTAFTPNGDGDNDQFRVSGFNEGNAFEIRIWDRWGHLVMQSDDMNFFWNGRLADNNLAPLGVYVYDILYQKSDGEYQEIHGQFNLLR